MNLYAINILYSTKYCDDVPRLQNGKLFLPLCTRVHENEITVSPMRECNLVGINVTDRPRNLHPLANIGFDELASLQCRMPFDRPHQKVRRDIDNESATYLFHC